jgi:hypothetical protein
VVEFLAVLRDIFICSVKWALCEHPIQWLMGIMWPGHEAGHSPTSTAKVRNEWSYIFTPPYAFTLCTGLHISLYLCLNKYNCVVILSNKPVPQMKVYGKLHFCIRQYEKSCTKNSYALQPKDTFIYLFSIYSVALKVAREL